MFKQIYNYYLGFDKKIKQIMKNGFSFSLFVLTLSILVLCTYEFFFSLPNLYYIGINLFKLSLIYFTCFLCFGFAFSRILNEIG